MTITVLYCMHQSVKTKIATCETELEGLKKELSILDAQIEKLNVGNDEPVEIEKPKAKKASKKVEVSEADESGETDEPADDLSFLDESEQESKKITYDDVRAELLLLAKKSDKAAEACKQIVVKYSKDKSAQVKKVPEEKLETMMADILKLKAKVK